MLSYLIVVSWIAIFKLYYNTTVIVLSRLIQSYNFHVINYIAHVLVCTLRYILKRIENMINIVIFLNNTVYNYDMLTIWSKIYPGFQTSPLVILFINNVYFLHAIQILCLNDYIKFLYIVRSIRKHVTLLIN